MIQKYVAGVPNKFHIKINSKYYYVSKYNVCLKFFFQKENSACAGNSPTHPHKNVDK